MVSIMLTVGTIALAIFALSYWGELNFPKNEASGFFGGLSLVVLIILVLIGSFMGLHSFYSGF